MTILLILSPLLAAAAVIAHAEWRLSRREDALRIAEEYAKGAQALHALETDFSMRIGTILSALSLVEKVVKAHSALQADTNATLRLFPPALDALKERFDARLDEIEERKLPEIPKANAQGFLSRIQSARALMVKREEESLKAFNERAALAQVDPDSVPIRVEGGA